jgi:hypothetical protein
MTMTDPRDDPAAAADARRNLRQEEKQQRKRDALAAIELSGFAYRLTNNSENVLFREPGKPHVDFYPSTGKWRRIHDGSHGYINSGGVEVFLEWYARQNSNPQTR